MSLAGSVLLLPAPPIQSPQSRPSNTSDMQIRLHSLLETSPRPLTALRIKRKLHQDPRGLASH